MFFFLLFGGDRWALARSWQAKAWFKPDLQGDGEEDQGLDILEGVRAAALDRVEVRFVACC